MTDTTKIFTALSNDARYSTLRMLSGDQEKTVTKLRDDVSEDIGFPISQSAFSQHLRILREADLLSIRRESQYIHYSLNGDTLSYAIDQLQDLLH